MDKILKIQSEIGVLSKTETNPFFKSKYMDINGLLAQLLPLLEKYNLTVIQPLSEVNGRPAIRTMVWDNEEIKVSEDISRRLNIDQTITLPDLQDPQKMGSAITYYRRYALQSLFLLQAKDDDGELATDHEEKKSSMIKNDPKKKGLDVSGDEPFIS